MAETERLKLPKISGNMTADVVRDLNALADAIDEKVASLDDISDIDVPVTSVNSKTGDVVLNADDVGAPTVQQHNQLAQDVSDLDDAVAAHLAETAQAHKAKNIVVEDPNNRFTGTDVEAVLNELFTFANDGKSSIAAVIGSPATSGDTFATLANHITNHKSSLANSLGSGSGADSLQTLVSTRLQGLKNTLATNLTNKGQTASGTESLQSLINKVASITTGKKWASGTVSITDSSSVSVTGLAFNPKYVLCYISSKGEAAGNFNGNSSLFSTPSTNMYQANSSISLGTGGFTVYYSQNVTIDWIAFE